MPLSYSRRKVFITFHHEDQRYKDRFEQLMRGHIVGKAVNDGDIDDGLAVETIRRKIRDDFIADATVTVVLVGPCTWQRKHVDWEISASLMDTRKNHRCGLLGILLPSHPNYRTRSHDPHLIPPRLSDNCNGTDSYSRLYKWTDNLNFIRRWLGEAFAKRKSMLPDNSRLQFGRNWTRRACSDGWTD